MSFSEATNKEPQIQSVKKISKGLAHSLMIFSVFSWGLEYSLAKHAMEAVDSITLIFFKYGIALLVIGILKWIVEGKGFLKRKDLVLFIVCALVGEILYFYMEYEAMSYMPVSLVTILLSLVPVVSILIEWVVFHRRPSVALVAGIGISLAGLMLIVGIDLDAIRESQWPGYLLCIGAVFSWNTYNYITSSLGGKYRPLTLTFNQLVCTVLLSMPLALANLPDPAEMTWSVTFGVLYLGVISASAGFFIYVTCLHSLGPTIVSVYANFMPITATFFGWILLSETISTIQMLGGVVVIAAGYYVIREKARLEELP